MSSLLGSGSFKTLRPHQVKAIEMIRSSFGKGNKRTVCQGPVGFGKTLLSATIIRSALEKGKRVIFTAPAISLINQTVDAFEDEGITDIGVMQANHPRTDPDAMVQVCSVQTLERRTAPEADLIIQDECHVSAKVIDRLMEARPDAFFLGLSATPWAKGMGLKWHDLVIPCSMSDLVNSGYLSKFRMYAPDIPDMSGVAIKAGDYAEGPTSDVMQGKALMGSVVETWLEKGDNRPTLLFAVNCAHAEQLYERFQAAGVAAAYVDANTDSLERRLIERDFRRGEVKVACSVRTLTTGVDWPVSCIIDAAPTRSEMLYVQKIGRGMRINPGTEDLIVLDHSGNALRLGLPTDINHSELDKTPKGQRQVNEPNEKLPKVCPACGVLMTGLQCASCGHVKVITGGVQTVDGGLVEIGGKKPPKPTHDEKQKFYSMALWFADRMGRKRGWAAHLYRGKFGVWPRGLDEASLPADQAFMNYEKSRRIAFAKRQKSKEAV